MQLLLVYFVKMCRFCKGATAVDALQLKIRPAVIDKYRTLQPDLIFWDPILVRGRRNLKSLKLIFLIVQV